MSGAVQLQLLIFLLRPKLYLGRNLCIEAPLPYSSTSTILVQYLFLSHNLEAKLLSVISVPSATWDGGKLQLGRRKLWTECALVSSTLLRPKLYLGRNLLIEAPLPISCHSAILVPYLFLSHNLEAKLLSVFPSSATLDGVCSRVFHAPPSQIVFGTELMH